MSSAAAAGSTDPSGTRPLRASMISCVCMAQGSTQGSGWLEALAGISREPGAISHSRGQLHLVDLLLELDDAVNERFGSRRAAGHEDIDGNDLIDALHERVVIEHAADRRTC